MSPQRFVLLGLAARSEYRPLRYRRYRFDDPTVPLAFSSALWSSLSRLRRPQLSNRTTPLVEFRLPESITQHILADWSQTLRPCHNGSSHGLTFPTARTEPKVHIPRALPARLVPPSGFVYPLDGLRPSIPCRFYFAPAALLGFTLRSFLRWKGIPNVSAWKNPHTVSHCLYTLRRSTGPAWQAAVPGFRPFPESLATLRVFNTPTAGCSLGFRPSRVSSRKP